MQILHVAIASYVARYSREPYYRYSDESFVFVSLSLVAVRDCTQGMQSTMISTTKSKGRAQ